MARSLRSIIKAFFETGDVPTQSQFADSFDSQVFWEDDVVTTISIASTDDEIPTAKAVYDATNLQAVTDAGNTTTEPIIVGGAGVTIQLTQNSIRRDEFSGYTQLVFNQPTGVGQINIPDVGNSTETFALFSDITSGVQSVTGTAVDNTDPLNPIVNLPAGGGIAHATASGTDTFTATISGVTSYSDGDAYLIRFTNGNTTGCTLNISSVGAKTLYRNNDGVLIGGDITAGGEMLCIYNSTLDGFQCIGTSPNTLLAYVTNADSVSITKGMPVYAFGGVGDRMTVKRALNTSDATSARTIGIVISTSIAAGQKGLVIVQGQLDGLSILPTSTFADGDTIYLGATAGSITNVKPSAPNYLVYLGTVTTANNGSAGRMYVRVQNGFELDEIHDVSITSVANKDVLQYESSTSLWKNKPILLPIIAEKVTDGAVVTGTALTYSDGVQVLSENVAVGVIEIYVQIERTAFVGATTLRIYANATNNLSGSPILLGTFNNAALNQSNSIHRIMAIRVKDGTGNATRVQNTTASVASSVSPFSAASANAAVDWTTSPYIVASLQNAVGGDSAKVVFMKISR